jgi:ribosome-binding factor A
MSVGELLLRQLHDPRIGFTTVTAVKMSPDLRFARVYVSVYGDAEARKKTLQGLHAATGFIRKELGHQLKLRYTPEIVFEYDESVEYGAHIEEVIQQLKKSPGSGGEDEQD